PGKTLRRLDRIEPVALVDGRALDDAPAAAPVLQAVEKARVGGEVSKCAADLLAHQDDDIGLRKRARPGNAHERRKYLMLRALPRLETLPAPVDELGKIAAEPGDRDLPVRDEGGKQLGPVALVAVEAPGLDQLRAGIFVVELASNHFINVRLARFMLSCRQSMARRRSQA